MCSDYARFYGAACCCRGPGHAFGPAPKAVDDGGEESNLHRFKRGTVQCGMVPLPRPSAFILVRELGSGSLGTNYKAVTKGGGLTVSLKVREEEPFDA